MVEEILPSLHRVVVPIPRNPLKEVNSYVLTSDDRNLVIDTGMNRPECREALEAGLKEISVDLGRTDFVATHFHADHQGLVASLIRDSCRAYMGDLDARFVNGQVENWSEGGGMGDYAARSGFPADQLAASLQNHPGFKYRPEARVEFVPLEEGQALDVGDYHLETVATPGHTPGHISFYEPNKKLFFAGDHVLGDITPNIQAWSDQHDPLNEYITSLEKVNRLDVDLCLPGHRSLIDDFGKRLAELIEHHRVRANEVLDVLGRESKNAYETASQMTWDIVANSWEDFPVMQRWFATGEAIAHLRYLEGKGLVERQTENGQILYSSDGQTRL